MTITPPPRIQRVPRPLTEAEQAVVDRRRAKEEALIAEKLPGLLAKFGTPKVERTHRTKQEKVNTSAYARG